MSDKTDSIDAVNDATEAVMVSDAVTGQIGFHITGTWVKTLTFEGTLDPAGGDWVAIQAVNRNSGAAGTTTAANGIFVVDAAGLLKVRVRVSADTSGIAVVRNLPHIG